MGGMGMAFSRLLPLFQKKTVYFLVDIEDFDSPLLTILLRRSRRFRRQCTTSLQSGILQPSTTRRGRRQLESAWCEEATARVNMLSLSLRWPKHMHHFAKPTPSHWNYFKRKENSNGSYLEEYWNAGKVWTGNGFLFPPAPYSSRRNGSGRRTGFRNIHFFQCENLLLSFLVCGTVFYGDTLSSDTYTALWHVWVAVLASSIYWILASLEWFGLDRNTGRLVDNESYPCMCNIYIYRWSNAQGQAIYLFWS